MPEMTLEQFEIVAELLRSREPVRTAARCPVFGARGS